MTLLFRLKRVLMYRGTDHFDVLPDGWVEVTHSSGLPVYLVFLTLLFVLCVREKIFRKIQWNFILYLPVLCLKTIRFFEISCFKFLKYFKSERIFFVF